MVSKLKFLPVLVFIFLPGTFIITYLLSSWTHVPNISDTAASAPESCFFGMLLNINVAMLGFIMYVRHKQIAEYFKMKRSNPKKCAHTVNLMATSSGIVACLGLDLVANFQIENLTCIHDIGIVVCYWSSSIYLFLQTVISYWMIPDMNSLFLVILRGFLGVVATFCITLNIIAEYLGEQILKNSFDGITPNRTAIVNWSPGDPGFDYHLTSGISEWVAVLTIGTFILTYYIDFKRISIYPPELVMLDPRKYYSSVPYQKLKCVYVN